MLVALADNGRVRVPLYLHHRECERRSTELHVDGHLLGILRTARDRSLHGRESQAFHLEHVLWGRLVEEDLVTPLRVGGVSARENGAERCRTDVSVSDWLTGEICDASRQNVSTAFCLSLKCCWRKPESQEEKN